MLTSGDIYSNIFTFNVRSVRLFLIHIITIALTSFWQINCYGQQQKNTTSSGMSFAEIKIEDEAEGSFKTLEIRYKNFKETNLNNLKVDGKEYKCFNNKKSAIKYYYLVKKESPTLVIYYVFSETPKPAEIYTFRISP